MDMTTTQSIAQALKSDPFALIADGEVTGPGQVVTTAEVDAMVEGIRSPVTYPLSETCDVCSGRHPGEYASGGCDDLDCDSHCN